MNKIFYEFYLITKLRKSDLLAYVSKENRLDNTFPLAPSKVHCRFWIPHCSRYSETWTKVQTVKNWKKNRTEVILIEKWQNFSIPSYKSFPPKIIDRHNLFAPLILLFFHPHPLVSQTPHRFKEVYYRIFSTPSKVPFKTGGDWLENGGLKNK